MQSSVYKKVGIASVVMMVSVFLSRVIGLLREMIIAWRAGAGPEWTLTRSPSSYRRS